MLSLRYKGGKGCVADSLLAAESKAERNREVCRGYPASKCQEIGCCHSFYESGFYLGNFHPVTMLKRGLMLDRFWISISIISILTVLFVAFLHANPIH